MSLLSRVVLGLAAALFACVAALTVYAFRAAPRRDVVWTAVAAGLLLALFILAV